MRLQLVLQLGKAKEPNKKSFRRQRACDIEIALALRLQARS